MSFNHVLLERLTVDGNRQISKSITETGGSKASVAETINDGSTNLAVAFTLDVSATKSFFMSATRNVTVKTNNATTPINTINLLAGVPYLWHTQSYDAFKLTADVTGLFVTNASGAAADLEIEALTDPTP